jgi:radical SAM protein with 4Fe4S-binding SPASM domain
MGIVGQFPAHLDLEPTNICNLDCIHCGRPLMSDNQGLMDWEVFKRVIAEVEKYKCPSIKLNWRGEPLIHPLLPLMVKRAKAAGVLEVQINTNAQLLSITKSQALTDAGLDRIIISADGTTKETYESIRHNASWDKLIENIKCLGFIYKRPVIRVQTCVLPQNKHEIAGYKDFWLQYADEVVIHQSFDPMRRKDKSLQRKTKSKCPQLWQRLVVSWNGDVHTCCVDWASKGIIGNVMKDTLADLWNGNKEKRLRKLYKTGLAWITEPCKHCDNFLV